MNEADMNSLKQKYQNLAEKNRARALFGLLPFNVGQPSSELGEDFLAWLREEFRQSTSRAQLTQKKLSDHNARVPEADVPMHLLEEWDEPQPEFDIGDMVGQHGATPDFGSIISVGFRWMPSLKPSKLSPRKRPLPSDDEPDNTIQNKKLRPQERAPMTRLDKLNRRAAWFLSPTGMPVWMHMSHSDRMNLMLGCDTKFSGLSRIPYKEPYLSKAGEFDLDADVFAKPTPEFDKIMELYSSFDKKRKALRPESSLDSMDDAQQDAIKLWAQVQQLVMHADKGKPAAYHLVALCFAHTITHLYPRMHFEDPVVQTFLETVRMVRSQAEAKNRSSRRAIPPNTEPDNPASPVVFKDNNNDSTKSGTVTESDKPASPTAPEDNNNGLTSKGPTAEPDKQAPPTIPGDNNKDSTKDSTATESDKPASPTAPEDNNNGLTSKGPTAEPDKQAPPTIPGDNNKDSTKDSTATESDKQKSPNVVIQKYNIKWAPTIPSPEFLWPSNVKRLPAEHIMHNIVLQHDKKANPEDGVAYPNADGYFRKVNGGAVGYYDKKGNIFLQVASVAAARAG